MAPPSAAAIKSNIQAADSNIWGEASARPAGLDKFQNDLATAIAMTWADVEGGFVIATVPVTGGASSGPGAPLSGGVALLAPGLLVNTASFNSISGNFATTFPDGATEGVLAIVDAVAQAIGQQFALWVPGYTATLVASGGACAWIAPTPATPPGVPGPWTGGSIEPAPIASGTSAGDAGMTGASIASLIDSVAAGSIKQNGGQLQPAMSALVQAVATGFETTWTQWKAATKISGGNGVGVAAPITGTLISGAVANPKVG
jgi:hypothetical protein